MNKGAREELLGLVNSTDPMREVLNDLEEEPVRLLCTICSEYARTRSPVPDHRLPMFSYFAETGLRALLAAGLIRMSEESHYSLHEYEPTEKGKDLARRLSEEALCKPG